MRRQQSGARTSSPLQTRHHFGLLTTVVFNVKSLGVSEVGADWKSILRTRSGHRQSLSTVAQLGARTFSPLQTRHHLRLLTTVVFGIKSLGVSEVEVGADWKSILRTRSFNVKSLGVSEVGADWKPSA